jgi:hypothetical protein
MADSTQRLIDAIVDSGRKVKKTGDDSWLAQCPAHNDGKPSLAVRKGRGQALTYCFAGCEAKDIVAAVNLTVTDLFDNPRGIDYEYKSQGRTIRTVHRTPDKQFKQSIIQKDLVTLYTPEGVSLETGLTDRIVYLPEGEKDADTLASIGQIAVSAPMGASAWAKCDYTPLQAARAVMIVADTDKPGIERANGLYEMLKSKNIDAYIVNPKVGKDATDHVVAGFGITDFIDVDPPEIVDGEFEEEVQFHLRKMLVQAEARRRDAETKALVVGHKLEPKTLGDLLELKTDYDWIVEGLLERKDRLIVTGGEGSGKSFLLRQMAVTLGSGIHPFDRFKTVEPRRVLVVDAENTEQQWARSANYVTKIGQKHGRGDVLKNVLVSAGTRLDFTKVADVNEVHRLIDQHKPDVVYIGPLYKLVPKEISTDDDAAPLIVALDGIRERGVVLLMEAHAGHAKGIGGQRDMRPRGSSALLGWPEFGYGLQEDLSSTDLMKFAKWRGDRDAREWPRYLRRGFEGELPWERAVNL